MFGKLKSLFQTLDVTAPAPAFEETRAVDAESSFEATQMDDDASFGDTQFVPVHTNYYRCACGQQWDSVSPSARNDACPACGTDTAPKDD